MNQYRVTESGLHLQAAFRQMIIDTAHSHWVTLNFHADYKLPQGQKRLRMWSLDVVSRLFNSKSFAPMKLDQLFRFIAFPEYTKTGHLHFHLPLWVHENRRAWFEKIAVPMWVKLIPTGSAHVRPISQTPADMARIALYATKHASRPFSFENFLTSNMLDLPESGGPSKQAQLTTSRKEPA